MAYRSNAAEAWYQEPQSTAAEYEIPLDLLPPDSLTRPLWRSLIGNLRDTLAPEKLPPLNLTSRPVNVGLLIGDRISLPWFRTVFTNIGDVLSPETLPPLELESQPVDVGELLTDQLSHLWFGSLLRNMADRIAPETQPASAPKSPLALAVPNSIDLLLDVELPVSVSFGRTQLALKDVIKLTTGSIVELNRSVTEPVEVIVNNCVIARGEVVVVEGNFGVLVHQVVSRQERLRTLN